MRESHQAKVKNAPRRDSMAYIRRIVQPKLMDKPRKSIDYYETAKPKNPPVPRFPHPTINPDANKDVSNLIEIPKKKPRPPPVPENLRASNQSPTPAVALRESMERKVAATKKPSVPRVSELLPGAILIKPVKMLPGNENEQLKTSIDREAMTQLRRSSLLNVKKFDKRQRQLL